MLTISAIAMMSQIQKSDVETAASASAPRYRPTPSASTVAKTVMSRADATAGNATRRIVAPRGSRVRPAIAYSPVTATGATPASASISRPGVDVAGADSTAGSASDPSGPGVTPRAADDGSVRRDLAVLRRRRNPDR